MSVWACDFSWSRPSPADIAHAGFVAVCRYLSHDKSGKALTKPEADSYLAAGLGIVLNFEDSTNRPLQGYTAGASDAAFANNLADSIGAPASVPIYYSVDTYASATQVRPYFQGIQSVGRRVAGGYGGRAWGDTLYREGLISFYWQANASSWDVPSGQSPFANMHQKYGHPPGSPTIPNAGPNAYDVSEVLKANIGAWTLGDDEVDPILAQDIKDTRQIVAEIKAWWLGANGPAGQQTAYQRVMAELQSIDQRLAALEAK